MAENGIFWTECYHVIPRFNIPVIVCVCISTNCLRSGVLSFLYPVVRKRTDIFHPSGSGCSMLVCDGISEDSHQNWKSIPTFGGYEAVNKEVCLNEWKPHVCSDWSVRGRRKCPTTFGMNRNGKVHPTPLCCKRLLHMAHVGLLRIVQLAKWLTRYGRNANNHPGGNGRRFPRVWSARTCTTIVSGYRVKNAWIGTPSYNFKPLYRHADHVAPSILKSWHLLRRQAAVIRSV
jgi:hypothetical protein